MSVRARSIRRKEMGYARRMHLFIVSRQHQDLYEYLRARLSADGDVRVIIDRRLGERRRKSAPAAAERRRTDRRSRSEIDEQLRRHSHAIVTRPSRVETTPLRDALQWIDGLHHHVSAVRTALAQHEQVHRELGEIRQTHEWLRGEADRGAKELDEIGGQLAHLIDTTTELLARLRRAPSAHAADLPDGSG
jgi:hypothetical protein